MGTMMRKEADHICTTRGCKFRTWNGEPAQPCCPRCHSSGGNQHSPACKKTVADVQAGTCESFASPSFDGMWSEGAINGELFLANDGTEGKLEFNYNLRHPRCILIVGDDRFHGRLIDKDCIHWADDDVWHRKDVMKVTNSGPATASDGESLMLMSSQGDVFKVDQKAAFMSTIIKDMADDGDNVTTEAIPLPMVDTSVLSLVIEYCQRHGGIHPEPVQRPLKSANLVECGVGEWDCKFVDQIVKIDQAVLFELIKAANFLDIQSLLDLAVAKVASMVKGRSPDEVARQFNLC